MGARTIRRRIIRIGDAGGPAERVETLAVEEPLELRFGGDSRQVTMRTPGHDIELAHGLLFAEGIIRDRRDVVEAYRCAGSGGVTGAAANVLELVLAPGVASQAPAERRARTSACGVCGADSIADVRRTIRGDLRQDRTRFRSEVLLGLPERLRDDQAVFARTGGIHAAGLFDPAGQVVCIREDVGRHNAVDKVVGAMLIAGRLPVDGTVLAVSGRASFELVQKAAAAGIPMMVAVSAPSSLAVELATETGMTLLGFTRDGRANVYTHPERVM